MTHGNRAPVTFREEQRIGRPWLHRSMAAVFALVVAVYGVGLYQQLWRGVPWGDRPASDAELLIGAVVAITLVGAVFWLLVVMTLITEVRDEGVRVSFWPLRTRVIPWHEIKSAEACTYRPLREYGGWGVRWGGPTRGWAYNAHGTRGVRLELAGGGRLLVGSQQPEALAAAMHRELRREHRTG